MSAGDVLEIVRFFKKLKSDREKDRNIFSCSNRLADQKSFIEKEFTAHYFLQKMRWRYAGLLV